MPTTNRTIGLSLHEVLIGRQPGRSRLTACYGQWNPFHVQVSTGQKWVFKHNRTLLNHAVSIVTAGKARDCSMSFPVLDVAGGLLFVH